MALTKGINLSFEKSARYLERYPLAIFITMKIAAFYF